MPNVAKVSSVDPARFETRDWVESSVLLMYGLPLIGIRRDGGVSWFSFSDPDRAADLIRQYWAGALAGPLHTFVEAQRRVKDIVHNPNANGIFTNVPTVRT